MAYCSIESRVCMYIYIPVSSSWLCIVQDALEAVEKILDETNNAIHLSHLRNFEVHCSSLFLLLFPFLPHFFPITFLPYHISSLPHSFPTTFLPYHIPSLPHSFPLSLPPSLLLCPSPLVSLIGVRSRQAVLPRHSASV